MDLEKKDEGRIPAKELINQPERLELPSATVGIEASSQSLTAFSTCPSGIGPDSRPLPSFTQILPSHFYWYGFLLVINPVDHTILPLATVPFPVSLLTLPENKHVFLQMTDSGSTFCSICKT